jgi:hypothetical protein
MLVPSVKLELKPAVDESKVNAVLSFLTRFYQYETALCRHVSFKKSLCECDREYM